ncbi:MAG: DNA polymerase III subunit gamma/tau [Candidatus Dojkabacteria bacterium]|nr:MAG: DNA polymerase III subunit gamma/tau [Candidatus Dojkabacteria bacterium]
MPSLYTQFRPKTFGALLGQHHIVSLLQAELAAGKTSHSYIFIGPRGTGKTTTARILAKALNCESLQDDGSPCDKCPSCVAFSSGKFLDLIEIDAASNRGIDEIREMKEKIEFRPSQGRQKVYIIDEVHMLTKEAFNALLKTLEEPPTHVTFILATTEPHKIPLTILSRCEKCEFRLGGESDITAVLERVLAEQGITATPEALNLLVSFAGGSYRDALSLLDTVIAAAEKNQIAETTVREMLGLPSDALVASYLTALASGQTDTALQTLQSVFSAGVYIPQFTKAIITVLKNWLVKKHSPIAGSVEFTQAQLIKLIGIFLEAYTQQRNAFDPELPLQLATLQAVNVVSPDALAVEAIRSTQPQIASGPSTTIKEKTESAPAMVTVAPMPNIQPKKQEEPLQVVEKVETKEEEPKEEEPVKSEIKAKKKLKKKSKKVEAEQSAEPEKLLTLEEVKMLWGTFLRSVQSQNNLLYAMLVSSVPLSLVRDEMLSVFKIEIGVRFDAHKKKVESATVKPLLQTVGKSVYGTSLQFVCTVTKDLNTNASLPVETSSATMTQSHVPAVEQVEDLGSVFDDVMGAEIENLA